MHNDPHAAPATVLPPEEGAAQRNINTRKGANHPDTPENDPGQPPHSPDHAEMPKLPHERDQSVNMTDGIPSAQMQQAYRDVERGLVDTDAGREAHNVGNPVRPADPAQPGTPAPVAPAAPVQPGKPGPIEPDQR